MSHPTNQHYVPRFLLKNFHCEDENKVWSYEIARRQIKQRSISRVASEDFFYDYAAGDPEESFEALMGNAENEAAPVIRKIINERSIDNLTNDEKCIIALFASLQNSRTKGSIETVESINSQLIEHIQAFAQGHDPDMKLEFLSTKDLWRSALLQTPKFALLLAQKQWVLLESDNSFYISDHPFVRYNRTNRPERGMHGFNSDGIEMYLPIQPSLVLGFVCERHFPKQETKQYCSFENVEYYNSLQVLNAERFIFSASNNFQLVEIMLDDDSLKK